MPGVTQTGSPDLTFTIAAADLVGPNHLLNTARYFTTYYNLVINSVWVRSDIIGSNQTSKFSTS